MRKGSSMCVPVVRTSGAGVNRSACCACQENAAVSPPEFVTLSAVVVRRSTLPRSNEKERSRTTHPSAGR